jgi:hypothetical protein
VTQLYQVKREEDDMRAFAVRNFGEAPVLTRTPAGLNSAAQERVIAASAAFEEGGSEYVNADDLGPATDRRLVRPAPRDYTTGRF